MKRGDAGFTLAELLVAITIMGTIMVVMGQSIVLGFSTFTDTEKLLKDSHGKQMLAAYFLRDVQNATQVDSTSGSCVPATESIVVSLTATDISGSAIVAVYSYGAGTLVRHICGGSGDPAQPVATGLTAVPTYVCFAAYAATPTPIACNGAPVVRLSLVTATGAYTEDGRRRT